MIEAELADGRVLEFPDGTDPSVIQNTVKAMIGGQNVGGLPSVAGDGAADVAQANGDGLERPNIDGDVDGGDQDGVLGTLRNAVFELAAGVNRGALGLGDLPVGAINEALQLAGSDVRVPIPSKLDIPGLQGGFIENPTAREIIGTAGEFAAPIPPIAVGARGLAKTTDTAMDLARATDIPSKFKGPVKNVVNAGIGQDIATDIAKATPETRKSIGDMVRIVRAGMKSRLTKEAIRPGDIAGDALLKRVNHLRGVNRRAGNAISKVSKGLKGKNIDITDEVSTFKSSLDDFGVRLVDDGKGGLKANFDETSLAPGDRGPIKEIMRQFSRLQKGGLDAKDAHDMKRIIDRNVTFGKQKTALTDDASSLLKDFRKGIDGKLDITYPRYRKANEAYADTIGVLDDIQKASGTSLDLTSPSADKALGVSLRRLMSNAQSRGQLMDSMGKMDRVGSKYGANFKENINLLANMAQEFDNKLGTGGATAIRQQVAQAGSAVADIAGLDPSTAVARTAIGVLGRKKDISPEKALDAIEKLVRAK